MNAMQHVLEEAGRLLKLAWRVSVPAGGTAGDSSNNQQVERSRKKNTPQQIYGIPLISSRKFKSLF